VTGPSVVERTIVPPAISSVPLTRRWLAERLAADPRELRETAALLTSELVTNAVLHAATEITITIRREPTGLRVEVADDDPQLPAVKQYDEAAATGRGLSVVTALADDWGVTRRAVGKVVWFELGDTTVPVEDLSQEAPVPQPGVEVVPVALLGVPVAAMTRTQAFYDELFREFRLVVESGVAHDAIHSRLLALVDEVGTRFGGFTTGVEAVWRRAVEEEVAAVDLHFEVPAELAALCERYDRLLDEADAFCRAGALMTLAATSEALAVRKWLLDEFVRQLAGDTAVAWGGSVWARSLGADEGSAPS
jgi:anti-sigma regulatory factor (Ser/Thr protein kinase)